MIGNMTFETPSAFQLLNLSNFLALPPFLNGEGEAFYINLNSNAIS